jgi:hypothetical protein
VAAENYHDVARREGWHENLVDVEAEFLAIDRTIEQPWCLDAGAAPPGTSSSSSVRAGPWLAAARCAVPIPGPERENSVGERTRTINRIKAALSRLGIRGFKPELRQAPQRLEALCTSEDGPIPPNMLDEIRRDMARLTLVRAQIDAIERVRCVCLEQAPVSGPHVMGRGKGRSPDRTIIRTSARLA